MAENLTRAECTALQNADTSVLKNYVREGAQKLTSNDLKVLRQNDFKGILKAGILFLLLLFSGFFPEPCRHLAFTEDGAADRVQTA